MTTLSTIIPVFSVLILGFCAKQLKVVTQENVNGIMNVLVKTFLPIVIFTVMFSAQVSKGMLPLIIFILILQILGLLFGKILTKILPDKFSNVSYFLMTTSDGGSICYPLYATLVVGSQFISNVLLLDLASVIMIFLVIPIIVNKTIGGNKSTKELVLSLIKNPIIIGLLLGLVLNQLGLYKLLASSQYMEIYGATITMISSPVVGMILFTIGYNFKIEKDNIVPLLKTVLARVLFMGIAVFLVITVFPWIIDDTPLYIAALLYFMCPPYLILPLQLKELFKTPEEATFISTFTSLYMVITLVAFSLIATYVV